MVTLKFFKAILQMKKFRYSLGFNCVLKFKVVAFFLCGPLRPLAFLRINFYRSQFKKQFVWKILIEKNFFCFVLKKHSVRKCFKKIDPRCVNACLMYIVYNSAIVTFQPYKICRNRSNTFRENGTKKFF